MAKRKRIEGILSNQKPMKPPRYRRAWFKTQFKRMAILSVLVASGALIFTVYQYRSAIDAFFFPNQKKDWVVHLQKIDGNPKISEDLLLRMPETIKNMITETGSLSAASAKLQKDFEVKLVRFVQTDNHTVYVSLFFREPRFRVSADQIRLLSTEGDVYGQPTTPQERSLPLISGIFMDNDIPIRLHEDGSVALSNQQKIAIQDVLHLAKLAEENKVIYTEMNYVPFRGVTLLDHQTGVEISLGKPPFEKKISRLEKILLKLKQKGTVAERIELDYDGKAFIKEKSL